MSGDKNKPDPYKAEHDAADRQNGALDAFTGMTSWASPFGSGRGLHFGKTNFEGHELNEMIDIVKSASPELLENASRALVDADEAIRKAADELKKNLGDVDWEGEAHRAFSAWGQNLVTTAHELADYAHAVGTQIMAAGSGLASVRNSMPPRDNRSERKTVDDIPEAKRVESNDEYTAAVKAEKHRQEAINQMYRLASFYTVSHGTMAKAEEPVFPRMPDVGVPPPERPIEGPLPAPGQEGPLTGARSSGVLSHHSVNAPPERPQPDGPLPSVPERDASVARPNHLVGTEIDSVGTLPPQEAAKQTPGTPPSPQGPNAPSVTGVPTLPPAASPPVSRGGAGRTPRFNGVPGGNSPTQAPGRVGGGSGGVPAGRTGITSPGAAGRASVSGQSGGRQTSSLGRGLVGRSPNSGGTAAEQAGGVPRGPVTGTGALNSGRTTSGRAPNGVVGGKPILGTAPNGSTRVPRGTVVGGEGTPTPSSSGERSGQRGVIGAASPASGTGQTSGRSVIRPDGVVGSSNGRNPGTTNSRREPGSMSGTPDPASEQSVHETQWRRDERRDNASSTD